MPCSPRLQFETPLDLFAGLTYAKFILPKFKIFGLICPLCSFLSSAYFCRTNANSIIMDILHAEREFGWSLSLYKFAEQRNLFAFLYVEVYVMSVSFFSIEIKCLMWNIHAKHLTTPFSSLRSCIHWTMYMYLYILEMEIVCKNGKNVVFEHFRYNSIHEELSKWWR